MSSDRNALAPTAAESALGKQTPAATAPARALLDARNTPWRLHVTKGEPAERIVELAPPLQAAGIVIGCRGKNPIDGLLSGSAGYKVVHLARVPVLVVP